MKTAKEIVKKIEKLTENNTLSWVRDHDPRNGDNFPTFRCFWENHLLKVIVSEYTVSMYITDLSHTILWHCNSPSVPELFSLKELIISKDSKVYDVLDELMGM